MRTTLIVIKDRFDQSENFENSVSKLFGEKGIIIDVKCVVSADDFELTESMLSSQSALFVVAKSSCLPLNQFEKNGITLDGGVFHDLQSQRFICCVAEDNLSEIEKHVDNYVELYPVFWSKQVFKLFGTDSFELKRVLNEITDISKGIYHYVSEENLDIKATLFFSAETTKMEADKAIKHFILSLKKDIYADDDTTLEQRLGELLKLRRMVASTAESMTGGLIASKIISVGGASDYFYEGLVTYNTDSKLSRLNVPEQIIRDNGVVSSQVAFEMAKGLLSTNRCSLAVSVTGYASGDEKIAGKCFIGVGAFDNVDVYQYKFDGTRNQVREKTANAGLFLMIKKLSDI